MLRSPFTGHGQPALVGLGLALATVSLAAAPQEHDDPDKALGPPALYETLRDSRVEHTGHIRNGTMHVDRLTFELTDGDLYLLPHLEEQLTIAVFLGDGAIRVHPPDGVEHQQLEKFIDDDDFIDEEFDRFVFWFASDDIGEQLQALTAPRDDGSERGRDDADKANDLLGDRRTRLMSDQLVNPDSRLLVALMDAANVATTRIRPSFFYGEFDTDDHGWVSVEVEPLEQEEVRVFRHNRRLRITDTWMGFHAVQDFEPGERTGGIDRFPRDPERDGRLYHSDDDDDDDWHSLDLGLSLRPRLPDTERWSPRLSIPRTDVDLNLDKSGDAVASAALVIEPHEAMTAFRLRLSPVLEVTDVRWRPEVPAGFENVRDLPLLTGLSDEPDEPLALVGTRLHFVQETHRRRLDDDRYEPWVTVVLPRPVTAGERFVLELSYEGELFEDPPLSDRLLLKDTIYWMPRHPDNRRTRLNLTYRVPRSRRIASGGELVDEQEIDGTRIARWVSDDPIRGMSFNYGQFDVTDVDAEGMPPISVYADKNHLGFAPGNREKTIEDLTGSIQTYEQYFGPYPFSSLLLTETQAYSGQAFPGLVLLSFQAFGGLHTGEAEFFRAHEVAHQWWGASVHWEGYRDQWISEGFADYSAALYALMHLEREDQYLEMLDSWRLDILGEVNLGQGLGLRHFGFRPEVIRESDGHKSGPLAVGYRLVTAEAPMDYRLLIYEKGAFVLHMLRMMLLDLDTGIDDRFRELMRTFVADHRQTPASTQSFEAAVASAFGEPMEWFFDQWVYGIDVPTYRPDLDVARTIDRPNPYVLHGRIRQEDVQDGFRMPVPIVIRFDEHPPLTQRVWVDAPSVEVEIPLPAKPSDIEFNYHYGVLAKVR